MSVYSALLWTVLAVAPVNDEIVLVAVGDVMLARGVGEKIRRCGTEHPFSDVARVLESADVGFCNLECVLADEARPQSNGFVFKANPILAHTLRHAGFDLVSVANNHTLDCGTAGFRETIRILRHSGIIPILAEPIVKKVRGIRLGLCAFNLVGRHQTSEVMIRTVKELEATSDVVIVSLHWGIEYTLSPSTQQLRLAKQLVDSGADLILGHHSHRVQGIGSYKDRFIVYSLGNFLFDQRDPLGNETVMLLIKLTRAGVRRITIVPAVIVNFRPERAFNKLGHAILARLIDSSARLNTQVVKVFHEGMVLGRIYPFQEEMDVERIADIAWRNHVRRISKNSTRF